MEQPRTGRFPDLCDVCERAVEWLILIPSKYYSTDLYEWDGSNTKLLCPVSDARKNSECTLCAFLIGLLGQIEDEGIFCFRCSKRHVDILCLSECGAGFDEYEQRERGFTRLGSWTMEGNATDGSKPCIRHRLRSTIEYSKITEWISCCEETHCHPPNAYWVNRVLGSLIEKNGFMLINSETLEVHTIHPGETIPPYAALSYVWGPRQLQTSINLERSISSRPKICRDSLPRTLKESILLARDLELPYIWIDRICIDQNTSSETKSIALQAMGAIYAAAILVIAAAAGNDANSGLPGTRGHDRDEMPCFRTSDQSGSQIEIMPKVVDDLGSKLSASAWARRGWTFQEYVFARRALLVFPEEMFFVCTNPTLQREAFSRNPSIGLFALELNAPELNAREDMSWLMRSSLFSASTFSREAYAQAVGEFTWRDLTFEKDRLDAFKGMILDHGDGQHDVSVATGLPMHYFGLALTWRARYYPRSLRKRVPSIAPSWSWGSAGMPVYYGLRLMGPHFVDNFSYKSSPHRNSIVGRPRDKYLHGNEAFPRTDPVTIQSLIPERDLVSQEAPTIHLATLVFHGYLRRDVVGEISYIFTDLGDSLYGGLEVDPWRQEVMQKSPNLFAVVSSARHLRESFHSIMLLHRTGDHYERAGMCTIRDEKLATLLKAEDAKPSWRYIKLR